MARQIKHAELDGYQASGVSGSVTFQHNTEDVSISNTILFDAHKLAQVVAILKVAARDALKADSSAEFVVKARAPRSPNKSKSAK